MKKLSSYIKENPIIGKGWGCGYIVIPENHPAYKLAQLEKSQDNEYYYFQVKKSNQEITFCEFENDYLTIGFDTAHSWNNSSHDKNYVEKETELLKLAVDNITTIELEDYKETLIQQKLDEIKTILNF